MCGVCVCVCVCACVYVCVCDTVSVCLPPRLVINSGVMWCDMDLIWLVNKFYSFYMAAMISIVSRHGLRIEVHCRNQSNKSKLALYTLLLHFHSHLKQLYISNQTNHFTYKGGCDVLGHTHIDMSQSTSIYKMLFEKIACIIS